MDPKQATLALAKAHSYEELRILASCAIAAMSLQTIAKGEELRLNETSTQGDIAKVTQLARAIGSAAVLLGGPAKLPPGADIRCSAEELAGAQQLVESAVDPTVNHLNNLYYSS
jgi:hypothetical protein